MLEKIGTHSTLYLCTLFRCCFGCGRCLSGVFYWWRCLVSTFWGTFGRKTYSSWILNRLEPFVGCIFVQTVSETDLGWCSLFLAFWWENTIYPRSEKNSFDSYEYKFLIVFRGCISVLLQINRWTSGSLPLAVSVTSKHEAPRRQNQREGEENPDPGGSLRFWGLIQSTSGIEV